MSVALKKSQPPVAAKTKPAPKATRLVSEVDVLIARLKKIRKGQTGSFDIRQAIEDGRA
jgi:hypothetical protein